jgi:tRNA-specific adenosine deaminase 1
LQQSDKLARWNVLGIQSALLTFLFHPIYLSSVTIGDMYDHEAIKRALCQRLSSLEGLPSSYKLNCPIIAKTDIPFEASKSVLEKRYASTIPSSTCNTRKKKASKYHDSIFFFFG